MSSGNPVKTELLDNLIWTDTSSDDENIDWAKHQLSQNECEVCWIAKSPPIPGPCAICGRRKVEHIHFPGVEVCSECWLDYAICPKCDEFMSANQKMCDDCFYEQYGNVAWAGL